jgi:hypothetical protein
MEYIIQSAMAGLGISEQTRPREVISRIRLGVAKTIRSKRTKFSREEKVRRICEQIFFPLKFPSIRPDWLINHLTGKCMEIDLYNNDLNLAIAVMGEQHNIWIKHFQTYKEWLGMKDRDILKATILRKMKIRLLYVPSIKKLPDECLEEFIMKNIKLS